jgi:hypothetical protein
VERLDRDRFAARVGHLEGHVAVDEQVQRVGDPAVPDHELAGGQPTVVAPSAIATTCSAASPRQKGWLAMATRRASGSAVSGGLVGPCRPWRHLPSVAAGAAVARMAATSSVRSIPTGHQVMHRPQPTQPDVSNWSIQVASLWVIHWR